jgi:hypothetical protein
MKYLKLYESFIKLIKENVEGKKFFLLLAPSASGKTTFANNQGIYHWYDNPKADKVLVGTDNVGKIEANQLLYDIVSKDMPKLSELMKKAGDSLHLLEEYKDVFNKWQEEASEQEKSRYEEVKKSVGYDKRCIDSKGREDGRVTFMAWVAYYLPAKTIIFDDISDAITNYFSVETILLFTPLDHFLDNIKTRNDPNSENYDKSSTIDVNKEDTALYQYCQWFQATDKPDLDNKFYAVDNTEKMIASTGHNNPKEILDLLGVSNEMANGFYLTVRAGNNFNKIINSRDPSTGRAEDASSLNF